jgi:tRNA pseudouridine38-40 synthase
MARYQIILAYDGTQFKGFQRQQRKIQAVRTVQAVVEDALRQLGWQGETILAAGRTDSGVHASGQVIAFDLDWQYAPETLQTALNANLPQDIAVRSANLVEVDFHPRYDAIARRYRYSILCQPVRDPLQERYVWRVWPAVTLEFLQGVALQLLGTHDFRAFGAPPRGVGSTVRSVYRAGWRAEQGRLVFEIEANAFLYRMVRRVVYAQVLLAQGKLPSDAIEVRVTGKLAEMVQGLAPPQGLVLAEVIYKE